MWSRGRDAEVCGFALCDTLLISSVLAPTNPHPTHLRINGRSDPRRHHPLSILPLSTLPRQLIARDRVVYVTPRLWSVDLSDPRTPVVTDSLWQPLESAWRVVAELPGGFAAISNFSELAICSTADPLHPTVRSRTLVSDFDPDWEMATAELHGRWEVILRGSHELFRYDVSDPDAPVLIEHDTENFVGADKIAIDGTKLYVSDYWTQFKVFELLECGVALLDTLGRGIFHTRGMAVRGGRLYVSEGVYEKWSRLSLYTYRADFGLSWEDQIWGPDGYVLAPPGQRMIVFGQGHGLYVYRDLDAPPEPGESLLPVPEVAPPARFEGVPPG